MRKLNIRYKILFLLLFFSTLLYSQNLVLESLENIEDENLQNTVIVDSIIQLAKNYVNDQKLDSAILIANKGLFIAKKMDYLYGIGELYGIKGDVEVIQNELFQALDYYKQSVDYFSKGKDMLKLANIFLVIGNIYFTQSDYAKALEYYHRGLQITDSLNYVPTLVHFYNNLGSVYEAIKQYDKSIDNLKHALSIYLDNNDSAGLAIIHTNLSGIYFSIDSIEKARKHIEQAFIISKKLGSHKDLINCYTMMGAIAKKDSNYTKALSYYEKGLEYFNKIGKEYMGPKSIFEVNLYTNIGFCNMMLKNYDLAENNLLKGYRIALKNGQISDLEKASLYLSDLYRLKGDMAGAYKYYRYYKMYSDSLSQEESIKKITQLQMQYDFDKKMKKNELEQARKDSIQKRRELIYLMVSSTIFLALLILFLLFRLQKNKVERIRLKSENLQTKLYSKNKELTTNVMYLLQKNEFIISISDKLKKQKYEFKPGNRELIEKIIKELELNTKEQTWKDFELRFQEVHTDFYDELISQFPNLTPNELRLCAFLRLNMTTKEISAITFQSQKSISMARFRLRKKMGIENYDSLISFLSKL